MIIYQFDYPKGTLFTTSVNIKEDGNDVFWNGKIVAKFNCKLKIKKLNTGLVKYISKQKQL